jgi:hypothetical protein
MQHQRPANPSARLARRISNDASSADSASCTVDADRNLTRAADFDCPIANPALATVCDAWGWIPAAWVKIRSAAATQVDQTDALSAVSDAGVRMVVCRVPIPAMTAYTKYQHLSSRRL